jgi:hypothetical protein
VCVCTDAASGAQSDGYGTLAALATVRKAASPLMQSEALPNRNLRLHSPSKYSEREGMRTSLPTRASAWGRVVSTPARVCLSVYLGITNSQSAIDT